MNDAGKQRSVRELAGMAGVCSDSGIPGPHVVVTAGVHGDEYEPMVAAVGLQESLPDLLIRGRVSVVAVVNESAFQLGSRYGIDGLDVARICPGQGSGSPSEQAAYRVSTLIETADYLVDMHTGGMAHDIYPLAGYMLHPSPEILDTHRKMARAFCLPVIWGTSHQPEGRTLSVARDRGVPAIYLEYGGGSGFRIDVVQAYQKGFMNLLRMLEMAEGEVSSRTGEGCYWVEDPRPGAGHIQAQMPAPASGIFIAEKVPGDTIRESEWLGSVLDPVTGVRTGVPAGEAGIVLSVRVAVRVLKGDALGVILPVDSPSVTLDPYDLKKRDLTDKKIE